MRPVSVSVRRFGDLRVEPWQATVGGQQLSLEEIFAAAGIELRIDKQGLKLPGRTGSSVDLNQLHAAIRHLPSPVSGWQLTVVLAPRIEFRRSYDWLKPWGIMFDFEDFGDSVQHREGCAVAIQTIANEARQLGMPPEALCMRTLAHEIGHTFNLLHPDRGVSVMCDTETLLGISRLASPEAFRFSQPEGNWLGSGPEVWVRPGSSPFRGNDFFDAATTTTAGLRLRISTRFAAYGPGEPVFLRLELRNELDQERRLARGPYLESGTLQVCVRKDGEQPVIVRSPWRVCPDGPAGLRLGSRASLRNNAPIHFGSGGFTLLSPGRHTIAATYVDHVDGTPVRVVADECTIMVRAADAGSQMLHSTEAALATVFGAELHTVPAGLHGSRRGDAVDRAAVHHALSYARTIAREKGLRREALELFERIEPDHLDIEQRIDLEASSAELLGSAQRADALERIRELHIQLGHHSDDTDRFIENFRRNWHRTSGK